MKQAWKQMGEGNPVQACSTENSQGQGLVPVAEQEATGEGDDEEDDSNHQFELLIFVFVGKSVGRKVDVMTQRGSKGSLERERFFTLPVCWGASH